jgi:zinc transport system substrate-binding protein
MTTLYPLEYFASRIGGATISIVNIVPPGVETHDFEPSPADIRTIAEANLVLYNGAGFEPWMGRALDSSGTRARVVEVSAGLADLKGGEEERGDEEATHDGEEEGQPGLDPHVWLDPLKAAEQVKQVRDAIVQLNPDLASQYDRAANQLLAELDVLHQEFAAGLADCRLDHFVTTHIAFAYLAKRYGLEQLAISGLSPEAERTPTELARLTDQLKELGVKHVLVEPNIGTKQAETLAREIGAAILPLHPLESLTPDEVQRGETYFTIMRANLANLRTALDCT